jgi:hypothetical protein
MAAREQFRVLTTNANCIVGSGCKPRMRDPSAPVRRYGYSGRHSRLLSGGCRFRRESEADGEAALRAIRKERCRLQSEEAWSTELDWRIRFKESMYIYTSLVAAYILGDEKWERMGPLVPGKARRSRSARRQRPQLSGGHSLDCAHSSPPGSHLQPDFGDWNRLSGCFAVAYRLRLRDV